MLRTIVRYLAVAVVAASPVTITPSLLAQPPKQFRLGYFEGGLYPVHAILRAEFDRQLRLLLPKEYEAAFVPEGYRSAGWKRDSCRIMAGELTALKSIDMVVALGPWVVEDLLAAGFDRPILAMHQFDPVAQGLIGADGKPIAPNLTVQTKPGRLQRDLSALTQLITVKRLGALYFPSGDESPGIIAAIDSLGDSLGFDVVTGSGVDNYGTYAFFKAYNQLSEKVDALYLPPLWGMNETKMVEFLARISRQGIPVFTAEPLLIVERGAFACNSAFSTVSDSRFNALKAVRIFRGERPADLPIESRNGEMLAIHELTARQCRISLPAEIRNDALLIAAPPPESVAPLTLAQAVDRALSFNPGLLARREAVEASAQEYRRTHSLYLPQISASASAAHLDERTVANSRGTLQSNPLTSSLEAHQVLFSAPAIRTIQIAGRQREREVSNLQRSRLDMENTTTNAYLDHLEAGGVLGVNRRYQILVAHNLEAAGARTVYEREGEIDLLRWQNERHQAISNIATAEGQVQIAGVVLNALLNLPSDDPLLLDTNAITEARFWNDYGLLDAMSAGAASRARLQEALVKEALKNHPDVLAADIDVSVQRLQIGRNTARFLPTLDIRGSLNFNDELIDDPPVFTEEHTTWSVWGGVVWPLFLGTDRLRERTRLKAELNRIEFEQDAVRLDVIKNVRADIYDLLAQLHSTPRVLRSAELAVGYLKLVQEEYEAGRLGLTALLEAMDNARDAELNGLSARHGFYRALARLEHDVGWSPAAGATFRVDVLQRLRELVK
ncbi:MAG TPA: TolC family protein [Candidatus Deferrimicrobium sp.]|nr:TolC family protein [Candidatus Deferrimicrobium sp.]